MIISIPLLFALWSYNPPLYKQLYNDMNLTLNSFLVLASITRLFKRVLFVIMVLLSVIAPIGKSNADTLTVAVASNFAETLKDIVAEFEKTQSHTVALVRGSSGRHYAQIINGAPFDLFFSADSARVQQLVEDERVSPDMASIYAIGQLALWSPALGSASDITLLLQSANFDRLSIANPKLAPYGQAAVEVLESLGLSTLQPGQIVTGENVAQAYQFVATGNADLGFVALAQLIGTPESQYWKVPQALYKPITQELAVLSDSLAIRAFLDYLGSPEAQAIILQQGYKLPDEY